MFVVPELCKHSRCAGRAPHARPYVLLDVDVGRHLQDRRMTLAWGGGAPRTPAPLGWQRALRVLAPVPAPSSAAAPAPASAHDPGA